MALVHAVTLLPPGEKPMVVSPLGVVPKRGMATEVPAYSQHAVCEPEPWKEGLKVRKTEGLCGHGGEG